MTPNHFFAKKCNCPYQILSPQQNANRGKLHTIYVLFPLHIIVISSFTIIHGIWQRPDLLMFSPTLCPYTPYSPWHGAAAPWCYTTARPIYTFWPTLHHRPSEESPSWSSGLDEPWLNMVRRKKIQSSISQFWFFPLTASLKWKQMPGWPETCLVSITRLPLTACLHVYWGS